MPKMKTNSGARKRFRFTGSGKIKREKAYAGHLFTGKPRKRKRRLRKPDYVSKSDQATIRKLLGV